MTRQINSLEFKVVAHKHTRVPVGRAGPLTVPQWEIKCDSGSKEEGGSVSFPVDADAGQPSVFDDRFRSVAVAHGGSARAPAMRDDCRAIALALVLAAFLVVVKLVLIGWWFTARDINPLGDAPRAAMFFFFGADLLFCAGLAGVYRVIIAGANLLRGRAARAMRTIALLSIHVLLILFCVVSFVVTRIYAWPLDVRHLRSADDPSIIAGSIMAYAGLLPLSLLALGAILYPLLYPPLARALERLNWSRLKLWLVYANFTAIVFAASTIALRGIDTYGVKDNAVIYFITHYRAPLKAMQADEILPQLTADIGGRSLEDARSRHIPRGMVKRGFPVAGDASGYNVVLIQLESTSASYLDEKTTPNLMRLAKQGVAFQNHATVFSETTRASYGIYYSDYLVDLGTSPRMLYQRALPRTSIADALKQNGYETAAFHSGFLSYADLNYLFESGYDTAVDARDLWKGGELPWSWGVREEETVAAMSDWLRQPRTKPFFLLYATEFPHHPYVCPINDVPYPQTSWLNRYRNSLHYADRNIGVLIDRLAETKQLDNTLIVVVGDHGETVSSYPVGHGLAMSREEVFTPFIVSNPKVFPQSQSSQLTTNHLDIAPTLMAALKLATPPEWLGRNVLADEVPARLLFVQAKLARVHGVIDNGLIYVADAGRNRQRMYDFSNGGFELVAPGDERLNLAPQYQQDDELFQKWAVWRHVARASEKLADRK